MTIAIIFTNYYLSSIKKIVLKKKRLFRMTKKIQQNLSSLIISHLIIIMGYSVCSEYMIGTLTFSLIGSNTPLSRCVHTPLPLLHSLLPITLLPYNKDSIWVHIYFFLNLFGYIFYLFIFAIFFCSKKTYFLWVHFSCCFFLTKLVLNLFSVF